MVGRTWFGPRIVAIASIRKLSTCPSCLTFGVFGGLTLWIFAYFWVRIRGAFSMVSLNVVPVGLEIGIVRPWHQLVSLYWDAVL